MVTAFGLLFVRLVLIQMVSHKEVSEDVSIQLKGAILKRRAQLAYFVNY
jgi:hypothetical protein